MICPRCKEERDHQESGGCRDFDCPTEREMLTLEAEQEVEQPEKPPTAYFTP